MDRFRGSIVRSVRNLAIYQSYEIDLITLRKTPKGTGLREFGDFPFLTDYEPLKVAPIAYKDAKKALNLEFDNRKYEFAVEYFHEINQFLKFVTSSYDKKIRSFDQFTTTEFLNSLYIFKDMYTKGKLQTNIDNDRFFAMFNGLLKIVSEYPEYPSYLSPLLLNRAKVLASSIDFLRSGAASFVGELSCLANELDFSAVSTEEVCRSIDETAREFDAILRESDRDSFYTEAFWSCFIQVHRYKRLRDILSTDHIIPITIARMLADPSLGSIIERVNDISGINEKVRRLSGQFEPNINYILSYTKSDVSQLKTFSSVIPILCATLADATSDAFVRSSSRRILGALMPQFCNGTVKDHEFAQLYTLNPVVQRFVFQDDFESNYRLNALFSSHLYEHKAALQIVRHALGCKFSTTSISKVEEELQSQYEKFNGHTYLRNSLEAAKIGFQTFTHIYPWNLQALDGLLDNSELGKKFEEALITAARAGSYPVDLRYINVSNRESTTTTLDLSKFQNELSTFKQYDLGNLPYEAFLTDLLAKVLHARILEVYSNKQQGEQSAIASNNVTKYEELLSSISILPKEQLPNLDKFCGAAKTQSYRQIPDDSNIHEFAQLLVTFKQGALSGNKFASYSRDDILELYSSWIKTNYEGSIPHLRLQRSLEKLLNHNGGHTFVLDSIVGSQNVFDSVERSLKKKKKYVQIPDDLELHKFTKELSVIKELLLNNREFKSISLFELLGVIEVALKDTTLKEIHNELFNFLRLEGRLKKLFSLNGGYVPILDTILQSQSVFDKFDQSLSPSSASNVYKQVPDDFLLEDYVVDLMQLRTQLGGNFSDFKSSEVLSKLSEMASMEKKYNMDKRLVLHKLYRVLSLLFKHNGGQTFILDNVILNEEVFSQFEGRKRKPLEISDVVVRHYGLLKLYGQYLKEICSAMGDPLKGNFPEKLHAYVGTRDKYELPVLNALVKELTLLDSEVKHYPLLLNKLISTPVESLEKAQKVYDEHVSSATSMRDTSTIGTYDESTGARIVSSNLDQEPQLNKYKLEDFKGPSTKYTNIDELMSSVGKSRSDMEPLSMFDVSPVEKAKEEILNKLAAEEPEEQELLRGLTAEKIRQSYKSRKVDKGSVENFLKSAKVKQQANQEQKFRENKAYEWSKSMCHSKRSLELHNFFDPIPATQASGNKQYLLLTQDGQHIVSLTNPLGPKHVRQDMYSVLSRFTEKDAERFVKTTNRLQKKNWQLIGGGENGEKMMVFEREVPAKKRRWLALLRTLLATTGGLFVILFALDWYWSPPPVDRVEEEVPAVEPEPPVIDEPAVPVEETAPAASWKNFLWASKR